jgi:nicotinamide riboside kinase
MAAFACCSPGKADFVIRMPHTIAVLGAECSGKTSFARALGLELRCPVVPEFSRHWVETHRRVVTVADVPEIVQGQAEWMQRACEKSAEPFLVYDTNLIQSALYSLFYFGKVAEAVVDIVDKDKSDTYFVMDPEIPWEDDAQQRSTPEARTRFHELLLKTLAEKKIPYRLLSDGLEQRVATALAALALHPGT